MIVWFSWIFLVRESIRVFSALVYVCGSQARFFSICEIYEEYKDCRSFSVFDTLTATRAENF